MDPKNPRSEGRPSTLREFGVFFFLLWSQSDTGGDLLLIVPVARHEARGRLADDNVTVG
jgi:hypothetical protein